MEKTIGRFVIRGELGRGAQSVVYLAWDQQLQREVAIKTLLYSRFDPRHNALLFDEARTVSKFRHPNIVPIYDAGEQDGNPYLVFERVEGKSLAEVLRTDGPMPAIKAAALMQQIADALAQAHMQGIIHRDLKPSNVLIDARDGAPRVMDFGIAARVLEGDTGTHEGLSGTPAYLAPEYITRQIISPQNDVFAAGLMLIEMLTGKQVFGSGAIETILHRIATEPVALPTTPPIDPRLGGIIVRACALNPAHRYATAAELRNALNSYLGERTIDRPADRGAHAQKDTLKFLLRRMRHKSDFPALSDSVSAINKLASSAGESVSSLASSILKDYSLTNKILRLVNSAYYRQAGSGSVSTVSRAVIVLGYETIRNISITVLLLDHLQDKANVRELKEAFLRANMAGLVAKIICGRSVFAGHSEEAFICALFHSVGQMLAQYHFPEEIEEINKLVQVKKLSERAAALEVLGISFEDLGIGIARSWNFPPSIINSMRRLPEGELRKPNTSEEALHIAAAFGNEICEVISNTPPDQRDNAIDKIVKRFGMSLQLTNREIQTTMETGVEELAKLGSILQVNLKQSQFARRAAAFASGSSQAEVYPPSGNDIVPDPITETLLKDVPLYQDIQEQGAARGPREDAQSVLAAGIQDISNSLVDDFALDDILRIVIETIYRAMGFKRVLLALTDSKTGHMKGKFGLGPDVTELVRQFRFPLSAQVQDVFLLATVRGLDIMMSDIDDPKIADKVPKWYRERFAAKTFVLLPLCIKGRPVALIYCDMDRPGSISIPEKELTLLKTLRNQALLAIKQAG
jgi:eukaryotic-like serine/threonine-protein kinase